MYRCVKAKKEEILKVLNSVDYKKVFLLAEDKATANSYREEDAQYIVDCMKDAGYKGGMAVLEVGVTAMWGKEYNISSNCVVITDARILCY